jgi:hypothetical protein
MLLRCSLNNETMPSSECYRAARLSSADWSLNDPDQCSRRFLLGVALAFMFNDESFDDDCWLEAL